MNINKPLVSIILATYNWESEWLSLAIDSVLSQSYTNFELIIINDASTNNIEEAIQKYAAQDSRIVYVKNNKNLKLTRSLNKGLWLAKWEYIARIDDDDIRCDPDKLKKQVDFMENNWDYWVIGTSIILIDEEGKQLQKITQRKSDMEIRKTILQSNQIAHPSVLIRKSILDKVWRYDPDWNMAEDYELWCRIGEVSKLYNLADFCIHYRWNTQSISRINKLRQKNIAFKVFWKNKKYYPNFLKALVLRIGELILTYLKII